MKKTSFDRVIDCVDLDRGYICVGFKEQTEEDLQAMRDGNDHPTHSTAKDLLHVEAGQAVHAKTLYQRVRDFILGLVPEEIAVSAVRAYTSELTFMHCELAFFMKEPVEGRDMVAVAITGQLKAYIAQRRFSPDFKWLHIKCTAREMYAMLHYAVSLQGTDLCTKRSSKVATYPGPDGPGGLYCTLLTLRCLRYIGRPGFWLNRPNTLNNDEIYAICDADENKPEGQTALCGSHYDAIFGEDSRLPPTPKNIHGMRL